MNDNRTWKVLQKISTEDRPNLTTGERQAISDLARTLEKALIDIPLNDGERLLIEDLIKKSKTGKVTLSEIISAARALFQLGDIFKDYS